MKHILIPTDFSISSLNAVNAAVAKYGNEPLKLTLFHLTSMPTSIAVLLLYRRPKNRHENMVSDEFYDACQVLQNKYAGTIANLNVKIAMGETSAYLKNYLNANAVDKIVVSKEAGWKSPFRDSINPLPLLAKAKVDVEQLSYVNLKSKQTDMSVISMNSLKKNEQLKKELVYVTEE